MTPKNHQIAGIHLS